MSGQDEHTGHPGHVHDPDQTLVRLANRIGDFFAAYPEHAEAIDGVAGHIRKFWEPRMRRQLYAYLDGPHGGAGLDHGDRRHKAHAFLLYGGGGLQQAGRCAACGGRVQNHHGLGHGLAVAVQHLDLDISGPSASEYCASSYEKNSIFHRLSVW